MGIDILTANYLDPVHAQAVRDLLDLYAREPFGASAPLPPDVLDRVVAGLASRPGAFSVLATADGGFMGLANCFEGFSTFSAAPLVNIHDVYVRPLWRGQGVAARVLAAIERIAAERGCCAITLEVAAGNGTAHSAYRKAGFADSGQLFWKKWLAA